MFLNIARELVRVVRALRAGEDRAMDARRMPSHRRKCVMCSEADGPEADLVYAESFSQVLEIVGALVRVVTGEVNSLNVAPVLSATARVFAQLFDRSLARRRHV